MGRRIVLKVISGSAKGKKLESFSNETTKPTADRVKQGMMSSVQFEIEGAKVLDLFSGTGQLGIETLSRGAVFCDFVDDDAKCIQLIKKNLTNTNLTQSARVVKSRVESFLTGSKAFYDIIILDPPYSKGIAEEIIPMLVDRLSESGVIVCESQKDDQLPENVGGCLKSKDHVFGTRKFNIYRKLRSD